MAKRKSQKPTRQQKQVETQKEAYVFTLHRKPCRWDVLVFELGLALAERCRQVCVSLSDKRLRFKGEEPGILGRTLGQGFGVLMSRNWPDEAAEGPMEFWPMNEATAEAAGGRVRRSCLEPLLRKYMLDHGGLYYPRLNPSVQRLAKELSEAVREFLLARCSEGGDLADALVEPLGPTGEYFPDNVLPADPARSTGDVRQDLYELSVTIRAGDDAGVLKDKVLAFCREDPWIGQELWVALQEQLDDPGLVEDFGRGEAPEMYIADNFVFSATQLEGKTPIEVLLERQPDMDARQRERLERWDREAFQGMFLVEAMEGDFLEAEDLQTGQRLRVTGRKVEQIRRAEVGGVLRARVVPWEDHWLLSGAQVYWPAVDERDVQYMREDLRRQPHWRPAGMEDPGLAEARRVQQEMYETWVGLFGTDELVFAEGQGLRVALERFERHWIGQAAASQSWSEVKIGLPEEASEALDVGLIMDGQAGLMFHRGYGAFRDVFEGAGPLREYEADILWEYLLEEAISVRMFQRMAQRYPERMQEALRDLLTEDDFLLERDFERLLRTFKGEEMRRPSLPRNVVEED